MKDEEMRATKEEIAENKREIDAATPIVSALLRNKTLRALVPEAMIAEFEAFAATYG